MSLARTTTHENCYFRRSNHCYTDLMIWCMTEMTVCPDT